MDPDLPDPATTVPLDADDPRFERGAAARRPGRRFVPSEGPGARPHDPLVARLRVGVRVVFVGAVVAVAAVFAIALNPGRPVVELGSEADVRAAVVDRPKRVCLGESQPCAWVSVVDGRLLALSSAGPSREEQGRLGIGWCPSSGYYGSNRSGSRFDAHGHVVRGPAPRGLDRYAVVARDGIVHIDFGAAVSGHLAHLPAETLPPTGPDCAEIPLGRNADLPLGGG